jgi:histidine triad (HIT) family protein
MTDCLFCRIVARQSDADIEYEDDQVIAFKDIYPKAPVHVLIVPKRHIESIMTAAPGDAEVLGRCLLVARHLGELRGLSERGYRIAVNCGPEGGQVIYHVHFHFTAGRRPTRA